MEKSIILLAVVLTTIGCVREKVIDNNVGSKSISATVIDFTLQGTKTTISQSGTNPPVFQWKKGDVIGVVPSDGKTLQTNYSVNEVDQDPHNALFDGGAWTIREGYSYYAYFPCTSDVVTSEGSVTLAVTGQKQSGNSSLTHLGNYDFLYAGAAGMTDGNVAFGFSHMISLVRIQVTTEKVKDFKYAILSAEEGEFVTEAALDIADGKITPTATSSSMRLDLENVSVAAGGILTVWFAMLPCTSIQGKALTLTVTDASGSVSSYLCGNGPVLEKGKAYPLNGTPDSDAFKSFSTLGFYTATNTFEPVINLGVDPACGEYSCQKLEGDTGYVFRIFTPDRSEVTEISIPSTQFTVGSVLTATETVYGQTSMSSTDHTVTVVRNVDSVVTLEDQTNHRGYIINTEILL